MAWLAVNPSAVATAGAEVAAAPKYASTYVGGPVVPPAADPVWAAITQPLAPRRGSPDCAYYQILSLADPTMTAGTPGVSGCSKASPSDRCTVSRTAIAATSTAV